MARSNIKAVFENDVQTVWNVITDVKNYIWRTDLSKTEIISDKQFIEYTKNGYATTFTITLFEPYKRWEFDVENSNIKGHWIGIFTQKGEKTEIDFTEDVTAKKVLMKPFVKAYVADGLFCREIDGLFCRSSPDIIVRRRCVLSHKRRGWLQPSPSFRYSRNLALQDELYHPVINNGPAVLVCVDKRLGTGPVNQSRDAG